MKSFESADELMEDYGELLDQNQYCPWVWVLRDFYCNLQATQGMNTRHVHDEDALIKQINRYGFHCNFQVGLTSSLGCVRP